MGDVWGVGVGVIMTDGKILDVGSTGSTGLLVITGVVATSAIVVKLVTIVAMEDVVKVDVSTDSVSDRVDMVDTVASAIELERGVDIGRAVDDARLGSRLVVTTAELVSIVGARVERVSDRVDVVNIVTSVIELERGVDIGRTVDDAKLGSRLVVTTAELVSIVVAREEDNRGVDEKTVVPRLKVTTELDSTSSTVVAAEENRDSVGESDREGVGVSEGRNEDVDGSGVD